MSRRINRDRLMNAARAQRSSSMFSGMGCVDRFHGLAIEGSAFLRLEAACGPAKRKPVTLAKVSIQKGKLS